jgi:hypothetical protein
MEFETEKAAFKENATRFNTIVTQTLSSAKPPSFLNAIMTAVTTFAAAPKVSLNDAWKGITAAFAVVQALADKANTYDEMHFYNSILQVLTDELTQVVAADWQSRTKAYAPYTQAFKNSAASLKAIKEKADKLTNQLNLAADVLGAFSKLLSAFGGE